MRLWLRLLLVLLCVTTCLAAVVALESPAVTARAQELDQDVPPGNPVIGSDTPGDVEPETDSSYGLWAIVAVCLIGAGVLLVKVERWEARRIAD